MTDIEKSLEIVRQNLDTGCRNGAYPAFVHVAETARKSVELAAEVARLTEALQKARAALGSAGSSYGPMSRIANALDALR